MANKLVKSLYSLRTRVGQGASVVRLKPFDTSTKRGRSRERYRRVALTALASMVARVVTFSTKLAAVPLTLGYLGTERYGMWATVISMTAMLALADFGIGSGLLNAISEAYGKDDREAARRYVSSAFFVLFAIAASLASLFAVIHPWVPWEQVFNVSSSQAVAEAGPAMAVFVGCFLAGIPLSVARQTQLGYQEGFVANLWTAFGTLSGLGGVLFAIYLEAGLPWLILAMAAGPTLALFLNSVWLFGRQRSWLRPRIKDADFSSAKRVSRTGLLFFVLQIATVVAFFSDNIVVAQIFGADAVTQYAVPWELSMFAPLLLGIVLRPLWPAYGEAITRGDAAWVKTTMFRSFTLGLLVNVPAAILLVAFGTQVIHLWVGPAVTPSFWLLLGLGLWTIINGAISGPLAALFNGANVIGFQAVCATIMAVANLAFSVILANLIGLPGVIFGTVLAQVLFILIPYAFYIPKLLSSISARSASTNSEETVVDHASPAVDSFEKDAP